MEGYLLFLLKKVFKHLAWLDDSAHLKGKYNSLSVSRIIIIRSFEFWWGNCQASFASKLAIMNSETIPYTSIILTAMMFDLYLFIKELCLIPLYLCIEVYRILDTEGTNIDPL